MLFVYCSSCTEHLNYDQADDMLRPTFFRDVSAFLMMPTEKVCALQICTPLRDRFTPYRRGTTHALPCSLRFQLLDLSLSPQHRRVRELCPAQVVVLVVEKEMGGGKTEIVSSFKIQKKAKRQAITTTYVIIHAHTLSKDSYCSGQPTGTSSSSKQTRIQRATLSLLLLELGTPWNN